MLGVPDPRNRIFTRTSSHAAVTVDVTLESKSNFCDLSGGPFGSESRNRSGIDWWPIWIHPSYDGERNADLFRVPVPSDTLPTLRSTAHRRSKVGKTCDASSVTPVVPPCNCPELGSPVRNTLHTFMFVCIMKHIMHTCWMMCH